MLPYLSNRLPRPFTPLCTQEGRGGARSRDNLTTSERFDGPRCLQRLEKKQGRGDAQTLEETGCDTWVKHWQTLADRDASGREFVGFGGGWVEGRLGEGN